jgi:hypothetical protein
MKEYLEYKVRVYPKGHSYWYLNGEAHREDGPAVKLAGLGGDVFWYLNDKEYTEAEHKAEMAKRNDPNSKITIDIEGKTYRLTAV